MARLSTKVRQYLEANSKTWDAELENIILQNDSDGNGDYIRAWNVSGLSEPTDEQLATYDSSAQTEENNQIIINNRKAEYDQLNQFEMQFDDDRDGTTTWVDKINEIKGRHPK